MRRVLSQSRAWVRSGASCMEQRTARALTAAPLLHYQQPSRGVAIWSSRRREGGYRAMRPSDATVVVLGSEFGSMLRT